MKIVQSAIIAALLLALPTPSYAGDTLNPKLNFVGVWLLDRDASDSIGPLMTLIEAPWIARKLASLMTPTVTITALDDGGLRMVNENPIKTTDENMPVDGVERGRKDPLGRNVVASQSWNDSGHLLVIQKNHIGSDRVVLVESIWERVNDHIEVTNNVETEDGPLVIRRIFRRKH